MTAAPSPARSATGHTEPRGRLLVAQVAAPLRRFAATQTGSAGMLLAATIAALVWANAWPQSYDSFWHTELALRLGGAELALDLKHWINDGLMVIFFFVVGLEVKRELVIGELTDRRRAAVPTAAAVVGLAVPAAVYLAFTAGSPAAQAWGVVISTDTAFLLGVLALVGPACPTQLRVFLLTLAVADDVGALTIIALFYTDDLALGPLALAVAGLGGMGVLRYLKVWRGPAYLVVAVLVWLAMYASGVHPTLAGVVIALFVPVYPPRAEEVEDAARLTRAFRQSPNPEFARAARLSIDRSVSGNERLQVLYQPWSSFVIVPLFALANAGVPLDGAVLGAALVSPVTIGVVAGLVLGKLVGVLLGTGLAVGLRWGGLAPGLGGWQLAGGAALTGIGFTISLFIVDLALEDDEALAEQARVGVLAASLLAALLGWALFRVGELLRGDAGSGPPTVLDPPVDTARDHVRGPLDAPLTLVEYGDFECPFCGRATGVIEELRERFGDRLRYVFRHSPLADVHPHAVLAAEAAEAAGAQGRFWEMHDRLFSHQDALSAGDLLEHAAAIGLDVARFARELGDGTHARRVRDDVASAEASGVPSTPTFFIGGRRHTGPYDARTLAAELLRAAGEVEDPDPAPVAAGAGGARDEADAPRASTPALGPNRAEERRGAEVSHVPLPDGLEETPGPPSAYPRVTAEQVAMLERYGVRRGVARGEVLFREGDPGYDFFVVLSGTVAVVEDVDRESRRVITVSGAGRFLGELGLLGDEPVYLTAVVAEPGEVLELDSAQLRAAFAEAPEFAETVVRAFLLRRGRLLTAAADLRILGRADDPATAALSAWAEDRGITHAVTDLDEDVEAVDLLAELGLTADDVPIAIWRDGPVLRRPTPADLAAAVDGSPPP